MLAVAQHNFPPAPRATLDAAYEHSQDSDEDATDQEEPQGRSSSGMQHSHSRASSRAPLNGPASDLDHSRSPSLPDSAEGFGALAYEVATEITREVSIQRDWDIYAKRNDLST